MVFYVTRGFLYFLIIQLRDTCFSTFSINTLLVGRKQQKLLPDNVFAF